MIVFRSPKGWTGPKEVDGQTDRGLLALAPGAVERHVQARATFRSSKTWMKSYKPEELFDETGRLDPGAGRAAAQGRTSA